VAAGVKPLKTSLLITASMVLWGAGIAMLMVFSGLNLENLQS
ncbi:MAG: hypothetical protein RJB32_187, partial [Actinomycetota bacterium]